MPSHFSLKAIIKFNFYKRIECWLFKIILFYFESQHALLMNLYFHPHFNFIIITVLNNMNIDFKILCGLKYKLFVILQTNRNCCRYIIFGCHFSLWNTINCKALFACSMLSPKVNAIKENNLVKDIIILFCSCFS